MARRSTSQRSPMAVGTPGFSPSTLRTPQEFRASSQRASILAWWRDSGSSRQAAAAVRLRSVAILRRYYCSAQRHRLASFPTGVDDVHRSTVEQAVVAAMSGGLLGRPEARTLFNYKLYVANSAALVGSIIQVDPANGHNVLVAPAGNLIRTPTALAF